MLGCRPLADGLARETARMDGMAPASWIERVAAACAAVALAVALLPAPPGHAASHAGTDGSTSREIGGGSAPIVAGPSTTTRGTLRGRGEAVWARLTEVRSF